MTTTQKLTDKARSLGLRPSATDRTTGFIALDASGQVRMSATIVGGRFHGGYTVDRFGHVMSCDTVRDMLRFASW